MDHTFSKRSCLTSAKSAFNQTLPRGHHSEITDLHHRRGGARGVRHRARRTFVFKGSQPNAKRAAADPAAAKPSRAAHQSLAINAASGHSPASVRDLSSQRAETVAPKEAAVKRARSTSRMRTPATVRSRSRSRSTARNTHETSQKQSFRAASVATSQPASQRASSVSAAAPNAADVEAGATTAAEPNLPPPPVPPLPPDMAEILGVTSSSPDRIKTEESRLVSSADQSSDSEDEQHGPADGDEADGADVDHPPKPTVAFDVARSPSVVGYRKVVYSDAEHKWFEHWKVEEDAKRARERRKREAERERAAAHTKRLPTPHKVKGRTTTRMQVMFPTAIIKTDLRNGYAHNINMTDALRVELHKRKAPIVPAFYQEHILQFGKLPFRNNPRPHPVI